MLAAGSGSAGAIFLYVVRNRSGCTRGVATVSSNTSHTTTSRIDRERSRVSRRNHERTMADNRRRIAAHLSSRPCVDCGESDVVVLDFDHVREKLMDVSRMVHTGWPWKRILEEIAKCEVRCENCHRRRTSERRAEKRARSHHPLFADIGDPGATRTPDLLLRRETLYPTELRGLGTKILAMAHVRDRGDPGAI